MTVSELRRAGRLRAGTALALVLAGLSAPSLASAAAGASPAATDLPAASEAPADADADTRNEIVVSGQHIAETKISPTALSVQPTAGIAAVYTVSPQDISGLVLTTANDLLRGIPGVEVADLGNGGIPNGVTIRGWGYVSDGTAVRGVIDGATNNFASGPNANGSDDLNILIPEVIGSISVIKGPFDTRYSGNYAYAGTALFTTADALPNRIAVTAASFGKVRAVATLGNGTDAGPTHYYLAAEGSTTRGYRTNNDENKINVFGKLTTAIGAHDTLRLSGQLYNDTFGQPGYIRTDLVAQGLIGETSATDFNTKGWRHSQQATLEWQHRTPVFNFDLDAWLLHVSQYRSIERYSVVDTTSNVYPENAFRDKRWTLGLGFHPWVNFKLAGIEGIFRAGGEVRDDIIDTIRAPAYNNVYIAQPTQIDAWTSFFNYTKGHVVNPDLYGEVSLKPASWLKLTGGVRDDWFNYNANLTVYPDTATGVPAPFNPGPPAGVAAPLSTYHVNGWSSKPTVHGGIAVGPGWGFTLLANFGEGITSQWLNALTTVPNNAANAARIAANNGRVFPTLYLNPGLAPTKLNTKEVVLKYDNEKLGLNIEGGVYSTLNQGEIASDPSGSGNPVNLGKSVRRGYDVDARLRVYDRNGTSVHIGGNVNGVDAHLRSDGSFVTGTPPWTAGWNLDAKTPVGPDGQALRLSVQHAFVGGTYLTNNVNQVLIVTSATPAGDVTGPGILKNGSVNRLAFKLQYERPRFRNLHVWFGGVIYGGDRFGEMATTSVGFFNNAWTTKGVIYRVANAEPKFTAEGGVSLDF